MNQRFKARHSICQELPELVRGSWRSSRSYLKLFNNMITQDQTAEKTQGLSLAARRAFMKLPLEERRRQLEKQAAQAAEYYDLQTETIERQERQGGDIVEP